MLSNFCNNYNGKKHKKQQQKKKQQKDEQDGAWGITSRASRTAINMQSKCQIAGQMPNDQQEVQQGAMERLARRGGEGKGNGYWDEQREREYLKEGCQRGSSTQTIMAMIKATIVAQTEGEKGEEGRKESVRKIERGGGGERWQTKGNGNNLYIPEKAKRIKALRSSKSWKLKEQIIKRERNEGTENKPRKFCCPTWRRMHTSMAVNHKHLDANTLTHIPVVCVFRAFYNRKSLPKCRMRLALLYGCFLAEKVTNKNKENTKMLHELINCSVTSATPKRTTPPTATITVYGLGLICKWN